jgi:hypothetical protein
MHPSDGRRSSDLGIQFVYAYSLFPRLIPVRCGSVLVIVLQLKRLPDMVFSSLVPVFHPAVLLAAIVVKLASPGTSVCVSPVRIALPPFGRKCRLKAPRLPAFTIPRYYCDESGSHGISPTRYADQPNHVSKRSKDERSGAS